MSTNPTDTTTKTNGKSAAAGSRVLRLLGALPADKRERALALLEGAVIGLEAGTTNEQPAAPWAVQPEDIARAALADEQARAIAEQCPDGMLPDELPPELRALVNLSGGICELQEMLPHLAVLDVETNGAVRRALGIAPGALPPAPALPHPEIASALNIVRRVDCYGESKGWQAARAILRGCGRPDLWTITGPSAEAVEILLGAPVPEPTENELAPGGMLRIALRFALTFSSGVDCAGISESGWLPFAAGRAVGLAMLGLGLGCGEMDTMFHDEGPRVKGANPMHWQADAPERTDDEGEA